MENPNTGELRVYDVATLTREQVWDVSERLRTGNFRAVFDQEARDLQNLPQLSAPGGTAGATKGPSGKVSTEKYLENNWDKATLGTVKKSITYHIAKHAKGMSPVEYTQRALKLFADNSAKRILTTDKLGREAIKVVSTEGSGLFTKTGKIIWFHPN